MPRISELTAATPARASIVPGVIDPSGTPSTRRFTIADLLALLQLSDLPSTIGYRQQFSALGNQPPSSGAATLNAVNSRWVLEFAATGTTSAVFPMAPATPYRGSGLTVTLLCAMASGTTGNVVVSAAIERNQAGTDSISSDSFATAISSTTAIPGTAGLYFLVTVSLSGSQIDGLTSSDFYRLRIQRLGDDASDTATGILQLVAGSVAG